MIGGTLQPSRRVVGVVQARMGSSRLPGKALMPLVGKPVIWHVMERLARASRLDQVILATTTARGDDPLVDYVRDLGIPVVRGSESNVLARFIQAAEFGRADVVVRITGDCPLVDPWLVDYLVDALPDDAGYVQVDPDGVLIDEGIDPCATWALHRLAARAGDDPVAQEHVTSYFKLHPEFVPVARVAAPPERQLQGARISVDTPADLRFLERIYDRLGAAPGALDVLDLVGLLRADPDLTLVNRHVTRKNTRVDDRCVVIRCDGDSDLGLGHVVRCLAVAEALRDRHGLRVVFAVERGAAADQLVADHGFCQATPRRRNIQDEAAWIDQVLAEFAAEAILLDIRTDLPTDALDRWREAGIMVAVIDDGGPRRLAADLAFFPPVPQLARLDWGGFAGALYVGWDYLALRRAFAGVVRKRDAGAGTPTHVLVAMGGADPTEATRLAVAALAAIERPMAVTIVVGAAYADMDGLTAQVNTQLPDASLVRNVADMPERMVASDLAIIAFGMTAYEAAAVGTPTLALCLTQDHLESARALADAGALVIAGLMDDATSTQLATLVGSLIDKPARLARMGDAARALIDGSGADRIADRVIAHLAARASTELAAE